MKVYCTEIFGYRIIYFDEEAEYDGHPFDTIIFFEEMMAFSKRHTFIIRGRALDQWLENEKLRELGEQYDD